MRFDADALAVPVEYLGLVDVQRDRAEAVDLRREAPEVLRVARGDEEARRHLDRQTNRTGAWMGGWADGRMDGRVYWVIGEAT